MSTEFYMWAGLVTITVAFVFLVLGENWFD